MEENIFLKGCLVQLTMSKWGGIKQIKKNTLAEMVVNADHTWVTASKKLVEPTSLKPICKIANAARASLNAFSLPFPISGMVFIPKDLINNIDEDLQGFQSDFNLAVDEFSMDYDNLRRDAEECLGDLFNEIDYPVDIKSKFNFNWRFLILDVPNGNTRLLAPEVYEREKTKFIETMEDARRMATEALREEFATMVEHISERFSNSGIKPKIFKSSTVDSFYDYFQTFKERNIFEDDQLSELVKQAQMILDGTSTEEIRSNGDLKETIRTGMVGIESAIVDVFKRPRRRIIMD